MTRLVYLFFAIVQSARGQQISGNSISDFVGQLTNLFNQNGGIGGLGSALQQGPDGGFGLYGRPEYPKPGYPAYPHPQRPYPVAPPYAPYPRPPRPPLRPPGPPLGYPRPPPGLPGPPNQGFFTALASIARYDDLRCVPRLLCEVTSGGKPGYSGSQQSIVPLTSKDSLIALLTVLNFIDDSPLLVFGRAALLGYTSRGNSRACLTAYPTCPRDPDALVDYLNNHNGGFFRYFSGPPNEGYPQEPQYPRPYPYYPGTHDPYRPNYYDSRPYSPPYSQNVPLRYAGKYTAAKDYYQERIQVRPQPIHAQEYYKNEDKLFFPHRGGKQLQFPQPINSYTASNYNTNSHTNTYSSVTPVPFFPDRTGTGKLLLDSHGVHYADYAPPLNLINFRDQRSVKFPTIMNFPRV